MHRDIKVGYMLAFMPMHMWAPRPALLRSLVFTRFPTQGANILVDNAGVVKLADFGASRKARPGHRPFAAHLNVSTPCVGRSCAAAAPCCACGPNAAEWHSPLRLADDILRRQLADLATIESGYKSMKGTPYWMARPAQCHCENFGGSSNKEAGH